MSVSTKRVTERRSLHFTEVRQIVLDAEEVTSGAFHTSGNWSAGQILMHLARSFDASIDGVNAKVSLPIRLIGRYILKQRILDRRASDSKGNWARS
jgi:hypothetical protein